MIRKYWNNVSLFFLLTLVIVILLGSMQAVFAQPPGDPCPGGPPCNPDVPITGIEWLIALGAMLGIKRLYGSKRKSN